MRVYKVGQVGFQGWSQQKGAGLHLKDRVTKCGVYEKIISGQVFSNSTLNTQVLDSWWHMDVNGQLASECSRKQGRLHAQ